MVGLVCAEGRRPSALAQTLFGSVAQRPCSAYSRQVAVGEEVADIVELAHSTTFADAKAQVVLGELGGIRPIYLDQVCVDRRVVGLPADVDLNLFSIVSGQAGPNNHCEATGIEMRLQF